MLKSVRTAFQLIEPHARRRWALVIVLAAIVSAFEALGALLVFVVVRTVTHPKEAFELPIAGDLRDRFPTTGEDELFTYIAIAVAAFFVVRAGLFLAQTYLQNRAAHRASVSISRRLIQGYLRMPYAWHLGRNSAEQIRTAYDSVIQIVTYVLVPSIMLVSETMVVVGLLVILLVTAPLATVLAVAFLAPLVWLLLRTIQPRLVQLGEIHQEMTKRSFHTLQQGLGGVRDIKVLAKQGFFERAFEASQSDIARVQWIRAVLVETPRVAVETAVVLLVLAFLAVSRAAVGESPESIAVLGLFAYAVLRVMPAMNRVVMSLNHLRFGAAPARLVTEDLEVLARGQEAPHEPNGPRLPLRREIRVEHVSYAYPGAEEAALRDVNLVIPSGSSLGIVGPTGGGKSTLVDLILGLLTPTEGSILVDGIDIATRAAEWQRSLGVVPQAPFIFDDTLWRNIALGLDREELDRAALERAIHLAQLDELVASLPDAIDTSLGEHGARLSGGQRQRVAIARALYRDPDVLVFDEGTSALDGATETRLVSAIEQLRGNRTIITIAHRLSTVRYSDTLIFLDGGRLVDTGSFDALLDRNPRFREMAGAAQSTVPAGDDG